MNAVDLTLGLDKTHVLVTGGAGLIGREIVSAFLNSGAKVTCLDISSEAIRRLEKDVADSASTYPSPIHLWCDNADISDESALTRAFEKAEAVFGPVSCCVALASLDLSVLNHHESITDMPAEQWLQTHRVNVFGTFLTAKTWLSRLKVAGEEAAALRNKSLILVGSESGIFGERSNADYASGKSAVQVGLLQSLRADIPRSCPGARVNAVAPGPVDTSRFKQECQDNPDQLYLDAQATTALASPVPVAAVARSVVFLASQNWSSHIHGQILRVDSGKEGKLMWQKDEVSASA